MMEYNGNLKCGCGKKFSYKDKDTSNTWLGGYVWVNCPYCGKAHIIN